MKESCDIHPTCPRHHRIHGQCKICVTNLNQNGPDDRIRKSMEALRSWIEKTRGGNMENREANKQINEVSTPGNITTKQAIELIIKDIHQQPTHWTHGTLHYPEIHNTISTHLHTNQTLHTHPFLAREDTPWLAHNPIHVCIGAQQVSNTDFMKDKFTWIGPSSLEKESSHTRDAIRGITNSKTPARVVMLTKHRINTRTDQHTRQYTIASFSPGSIRNERFEEAEHVESTNEKTIHLILIETLTAPQYDYASMIKDISTISSKTIIEGEIPPWIKTDHKQGKMYSRTAKRHLLHERPSYTWFRQLPIFNKNKYHVNPDVDMIQHILGISKFNITKHLLKSNHDPDKLTKSNISRIKNLLASTTLKSFKYMTLLKKKKHEKDG